MSEAEAEEAEAGVDFSDGDALVVDLNATEDAPEFEEVPKGTYACVVSECEFSYSQSKGNPMWTLQLEISDGEYAGRILFTHLVFKGPGLAYTARNMKRFAADICEQQFDPEDAEIIGQMLGKELRAKTTMRKWEGKMRTNVTDLLAPAADDFAA